MGCQRINTTWWLKNARSDLFPEGCAGNVGIEDMMHRHPICRDRTAGIDQERASLVVQLPFAVIALYDILPADLAEVVRPVAAGLEIDNANSGWGSVDDGRLLSWCPL
jgi:hypothetical protein